MAAFKRMHTLAIAVPAMLVASSLAFAAAPLRIAIDHAASVTLAPNAASVLVADPAIANIVNERGRVLFILGMKPGATNLLVYDRAGQRLLAREIIVAPEDADVVTVMRATTTSDYFCAPRCVLAATDAAPLAAPPAPLLAAPAKP